MSTIRELLLAIDVELENYAQLISKARNPALGTQERRDLIAESQETWRQLEAAHRHLENSLRIPANDRPAMIAARERPRVKLTRWDTPRL